MPRPPRCGLVLAPAIVDRCIDGLASFSETMFGKMKRELAMLRSVEQVGGGWSLMMGRGSVGEQPVRGPLSFAANVTVVLPSQSFRPPLLRWSPCQAKLDKYQKEPLVVSENSDPAKNMG